MLRVRLVINLSAQVKKLPKQLDTVRSWRFQNTIWENFGIFENCIFNLLRKNRLKPHFKQEHVLSKSTVIMQA